MMFDVAEMRSKVYYAPNKILDQTDWFVSWGDPGHIVNISLGKSNAVPQYTSEGGDLYNFSTQATLNCGVQGWLHHNNSGDTGGGQPGDSGSPVFEFNQGMAVPYGLHWGAVHNCDAWLQNCWKVTWSQLGWVTSDLGVNLSM